ncbi:hypothetical protein IFO70_38135 [Phormidium tenue FACHB-886]|nr:hypothetical protein [Phormidium tenue FACHB-886]
MFTTILDKVYQIGRKVAQNCKSTMQIVFGEFLPQWNYPAKPGLFQSQSRKIKLSVL